MNSKQKSILIIVAIVVLAMLIYPPYIQQIGGYTWSGYALIFNLPSMSVVNTTTLLIQWVGVLIAGGIAYVLVKK